MHLVLGLYLTRIGKRYDYNSGIFYTILPDGLPDPLPKQCDYLSTGNNRNWIFRSIDEAIKQMIEDMEPHIDLEYYVITKHLADDDDIYFRISDEPYLNDDIYIIKNNEFVKTYISDSS